MKGMNGEPQISIVFFRPSRQTETVKKAGLNNSILLVKLFLLPLGAYCGQSDLSLSASVKTNRQLQLTLTGLSGVKYVIEGSTNLQNWVAVATNSDSGGTRVINLPLNQACFYRAFRGPFTPSAALVGRQIIEFQGNGIYLDAFDSSDALHFPDHHWNSTNAIAGADLATAEGIVDVGNAIVHGRLFLRQSNDYSIGPNGIVGDMPANWPSQNGIEPGWAQEISVPSAMEVVAPFSSGIRPPTGIGTNSFILGNSIYYVPGDFSVPQNLLVDGIAILYVTGNFDAPMITISPGGILRLYVGLSSGPAVTASLGQVNNSGSNIDFQFFGLPTNTRLTWNANGNIRGIIYAPNAWLTLMGGNNKNVDWEGACIAKSVTLKGAIAFHYDRNLRRN